MSYLTTTPVPPRTHEITGQLVSRLSTARMADLLGGTGRVYEEKDEPSKPEGGQNEAWGRVVVKLAESIWRTQELGSREKLIRVLVRAEVHSPGPGFDPRRALEAIQEEVFSRLEGFVPTLPKASVQFPTWRVGLVNDGPLWDQDRGLWLKSAEYRLVVGPT